MNAVPPRLTVRQAARLRQRLLLDWQRQGVSLREMARRLALAPKTVHATLELARLSSQDELNSDEPGHNDPPPGFDPANLRRCRSCGALVYLWPCLTCALDAGTATNANQGATCHVHP